MGGNAHPLQEGGRVFRLWGRRDGLGLRVDVVGSWIGAMESYPPFCFLLLVNRASKGLRRSQSLKVQTRKNHRLCVDGADDGDDSPS